MPQVVNFDATPPQPIEIEVSESHTGYTQCRQHTNELLILEETLTDIYIRESYRLYASISTE